MSADQEGRIRALARECRDRITTGYFLPIEQIIAETIRTALGEADQERKVIFNVPVTAATQALEKRVAELKPQLAVAREALEKITKVRGKADWGAYGQQYLVETAREALTKIDEGKP